MAVQIQLRRDTAADWTSNNPTLAAGEIGVETDNLRFKVGDGSTAWTSLSYIGSGITSVNGDTGIVTVALGQHTIWVPAVSMITGTTNGAAAEAIETTTNDINVNHYSFDASTEEYVYFQIQMPKSWNESTLIAQFIWSHAATTTNFGVVWEIGAVAFANDDALDTAIGTEQSATDTGGTTDDIYISPETSAITVAGTPGAEEFVVFRVARAVANGSDTMAIDARLHGVKIHYTTDDSIDD